MLLADSIISFRMCITDPVNPVQGPSQGGDSIVNFLHRLVGSSGSSVVTPRSSWSWQCASRGGFGSSGVGIGSFLSLSSRLPSSSASSSGFSFSLAPPVAHPLASVAQMSAPAFPPSSSVTFPPVSSFAPVFPFPPPVASLSS